MDWAVVTWIILVGMVGLLWVMAMTVLQDEGWEKSEDPSSEKGGAESAEAVEGIQNRQRSAA